MSAPKWTNITAKLGDLKPWAANPKFSTKTQAKRLLESWKKFGQVITIAVGPALEVLDGHQRLSALLTIYGADYEIAARQSDRPLTDEERRELVVTLHAGAVGSWNWDNLSGWNAPELIEWGMDSEALKDWKHDASALQTLLESEKPEDADAEPQTDRAEELRKKWQTERGQLWAIGEHRLLCGDSTVREDVERVMGGEKADCTVTDPPYGVGVDYGSFQDTPENVKELITKVMPIIFEHLPAAFTPGVPAMWDYPRPAWVGAWVHPAPIGGCPWGFVGNNPILFYGADPYLKVGKGRRPDCVVMASDRQGVDGHPTPKPLKVWEWLTERMTPERNQIVFDPFGGSGTGLVACQNLGRRCFAIELGPQYVALILERMATAFPGIDIHKVE